VVSGQKYNIQIKQTKTKGEAFLLLAGMQAFNFHMVVGEIHPIFARPDLRSLSKL